MKMFEMETYKIFGDQEHSLIEMTLGDLLDKVASVYPENELWSANTGNTRFSTADTKNSKKNVIR